MATAAVQSNANLKQTTSGPGSLAARKSTFAQNRIPGIKQESNINQIMRTGSSQSPSDPLQSNTQRQSALRANQRAAQTEEASEDEEDEEETTFQVAMQKIRIKGLLAEAIGIEQQGDGGAAQKAASNATQEKAKQAAKKMVPKAANVAANFLSTALDLGTGATSLLVTIFIHLIGLGWLNVEMVYGSWIKKGKDPIIGPLTWDPIPMPVDKNGLMLQGLVIMADILLLFVVVIMVALQALVLLAMFAPYLLVGFGLNTLFS